MFINDIELTNFRNYKDIKIKLNENLNIFYGDNAQGKTNILESIFLCSIGKSFRTRKEKDLIYLGQDKSVVTIKYQKKDRDGLIRVELSDKKNISINGVKVKKLSELLGNILIVIFTPDDINILKNGPANRRKFLNMLIGQLKPTYIFSLNMYLKILEQRNVYLRQIKLEKKCENMLDIWDEKLADYAEIIYKYREVFIEKIKNKVNIIHNNITNEKEKIRIDYKSDYVNKEEFIRLLKEHRKIDIIKGITTKGMHRDDFKIFINDKDISIYGSQGQFRTAIISLKIAELQVIYDEIGEYPILLLDDFMSELDENRRESIIKYMNNTQVIITCTDNMYISKDNFSSYHIKNGKII